MPSLTSDITLHLKDSSKRHHLTSVHLTPTPFPAFHIHRKRKSPQRGRSEHLSRCSFSAFSTSVYSKDDALLFGNSHIECLYNPPMPTRTPLPSGETKEKCLSGIQFVALSILLFHNKMAPRDKITIYHSFNLNSVFPHPDEDAFEDSALALVALCCASCVSSFGI